MRLQHIRHGGIGDDTLDDFDARPLRHINAEVNQLYAKSAFVDDFNDQNRLREPLTGPRGKGLIEVFHVLDWSRDEAGTA